LTLVVNWKIPIKGLLPFPGDLLVGRFFPFNTHEWEGYPLGVPYKEFINADVVRQLFPWRDIAISSIKQGEIPWWNPYSFSGTPLLANIQAAPFYPLNILYWMTNHQTAWILGVLLQSILTIVFMIAFMTNLGISKRASLISSIALAFSGYMVIWLQLNTVGHAALWLPFILWGIDSWCKFKKRRFLAAIVFGQTASLLAGHLQTSIYVFLVAMAYAVFRIRSLEPKKKISNLFTYIALTLMSLILALPQLLPAVRFLPLSPRGTQTNDELFKHFIMPLKHLATFLAHDFFGNPATKNFWGVDYGEFMGYFGVTALIFSIIAVFTIKKREIKFFASMAVIALLFALPTPLPHSLRIFKIPILSTSIPSRILFVVQFCGTILAGFGIDYWLKDKLKRIKVPIVIMTAAFIIVWVIAGIGLVGEEALRANFKVSIRNLVIPTAVFMTIVATIVGRKVLEKKRIKNYIILLSFLLILSVTIAEHTYFLNKFQTYSEPRFFFPDSTVFSYLKKESAKEPYRFFGDYTASVTSNSWIPYQIYGVEGYDSLYIARYGELLAASETGLIPETIPRSDANLKKNSDDLRRQRLQDLLGIRFIIDKNDLPQSDWEPDSYRFPPERYQLIWQEGKFKVYENTQSLPRAFLVGDYIVESEPQDIIDHIFNPDFDLERFIILEENLEGEITASDGFVEFKTYRANEIELSVKSSTQQLLFLSDSYYPDWKAYINDVETKIYRANYSFRAIVVPAGNHQVVFKYSPDLI
jgi:uncharacterized membrane protein YfhO